MQVRFQLQKYRKEKGLSQVELAKRSGVSQAFISLIEGGKKVPTVYVAKRLSIVLEKSLDELVEL